MYTLSSQLIQQSYESISKKNSKISNKIFVGGTAATFAGLMYACVKNNPGDRGIIAVCAVGGGLLTAFASAMTAAFSSAILDSYGDVNKRAALTYAQQSFARQPLIMSDENPHKVGQKISIGFEKMREAGFVTAVPVQR